MLTGTTEFVTALHKAQTNEVRRLLAGGELVIYSGAPPDSPDDEPRADNLQLWHSTFSEWTEPDSEGNIQPIRVPISLIMREGIARWFRVYDFEGNPLFDGIVGVVEADCDIMLQTCELTTGNGQLEIHDFVFRPLP